MLVVSETTLTNGVRYQQKETTGQQHFLLHSAIKANISKHSSSVGCLECNVVKFLIKDKIC